MLSGIFGASVDELIKGDLGTMEETCKHDCALMNRLSIGMVVLALLGIVAFFTGFKELLADWGWHSAPTFILALVLYGTAVALAFWCDRIKKAHDLVTYREIVAFSKGEPVDREDPKSVEARKNRLLKNAAKVVAGACVGAVLGIVVWNPLEWVG